MLYCYECRMALKGLCDFTNYEHRPMHRGSWLECYVYFNSKQKDQENHHSVHMATASTQTDPQSQSRSIGFRKWGNQPSRKPAFGASLSLSLQSALQLWKASRQHPVLRWLIRVTNCMCIFVWIDVWILTSSIQVMLRLLFEGRLLGSDEYKEVLSASLGARVLSLAGHLYATVRLKMHMKKNL